MAEIGESIEKAVSFLKKGEVVGMPTETVYGLAGNALDEEAILKIFDVKNRPKFDPLIAHVDSLRKVETIVEEIPNIAHKLSDAFWPGPLTLLLKKKSHVPDLLTSGHPRVAVRIPDHATALCLLSSLDFPLAAPSANPFGYVSPTSALHVQRQLGQKVPYILEGGECLVGLESTIVGFEGNQVVVYRLGGIEVEALEAVVGAVKVQVNTSSNPSAPGMLKSHYSPGKQVEVGNIAELLKGKDPHRTGVISFMETADVPRENLFRLSAAGDMREAARNLFKALRTLDKPEIDSIVAEYVPAIGLGKAINDRLQRAAV